MRAGFAERDLVLVGGGHAHVHVLKSFGMKPVPGVRLTLVARDVETPYSGMLPGFLAGHYRYDDCHIDLRRLASFARARLIHAEAQGIDRAARRVLLRDRPAIRYDLLSLDIGSTPDWSAVPGAAEWTTPVKPVDRLAARWSELLERLRGTHRPMDLVVVGGGAAGVEIVLSMQHRLRDGPAPRLALVTRGELLPNLNRHARAALRRILDERGIAVHEGAEIAAVEKGRLLRADGGCIPFDEALWTTQAGAAPWLRATGLALDPAGFVAVGADLRAVDDPRIFAAGDVASVLPYPREKAGVFAVRQGPPLADNLRRVLSGRVPRPFVPQSRHLSLISTGDRQAVAARGPFCARGTWVWRLKDRIDRRFMRAYGDLPVGGAAMRPAETQPPDALRCGGCGAKLPADPLARVLGRLGAGPSAGPIGADRIEDAAIVQPPAEGRLQVQTVDFFRSFIEDPYLFGRIAANHALGDIAAMGAEPLAALAIACVPPGAEAIMEDDLYQMLRGGMEVLEGAGARLVGGHSAEAEELALGFALTGGVDPGRVLRKGGLRPGDRLVLTKPLGTGTLLAAAMRGQARARWVTGALEAMQRSPFPAAACLARHGATACTDVTGFGLLGHLLEMLGASAVEAQLDLDAVPVLGGALDTAGRGVLSTLHPANAEAVRSLDGLDAASRHPAFPLLFDPQTAGGLLAGVPADRAAACVAALREAGDTEAAVIGTVGAATGRTPRVRVLGMAPPPESACHKEQAAADRLRPELVGRQSITEQKSAS